MKLYEICNGCGNDTFKVYKIAGELGTREECSSCGSNNIGFKEDGNKQSTNRSEDD